MAMTNFQNPETQRGEYLSRPEMISIDITLTQVGQVADAKATGNALNLKQDKNGIYEKMKEIVADGMTIVERNLPNDYSKLIIITYCSDMASARVFVEIKVRTPIAQVMHRTFYADFYMAVATRNYFEIENGIIEMYGYSDAPYIYVSSAMGIMPPHKITLASHIEKFNFVRIAQTKSPFNSGTKIEIWEIRV